jgi:uncharacterized protein
LADLLWSACALLLIIEGILPLVAPSLWRETFSRLIELTDGQLRFIGLAAVALGLVFLAIVRHA